MKKVGETKIGKHITYSLIRLPPEFVDIIGKKLKSSRPNIKEIRLF